MGHRIYNKGAILPQHRQTGCINAVADNNWIQCVGRLRLTVFIKSLQYSYLFSFRCRSDTLSEYVLYIFKKKKKKRFGWMLRTVQQKQEFAWELSTKTTDYPETLYIGNLRHDSVSIYLLSSFPFWAWIKSSQVSGIWGKRHCGIS